MNRIGIDLGGTKIEGVLLDEQNNVLKRERVLTERDNGYDAKVPFYNFKGRKVWGATAAILSEFKFILKEALD